MACQYMPGLPPSGWYSTHGPTFNNQAECIAWEQNFLASQAAPVAVPPPAPVAPAPTQVSAPDPLTVLHTADEWAYFLVHGGGPLNFAGGSPTLPAPEDYGFVGANRFTPVDWLTYQAALNSYRPPAAPPPPTGGAVTPFLPTQAPTGGLGGTITSILTNVLPRLPLPGVGGAVATIPGAVSVGGRVAGRARGIAAKIAALAGAGLTGAQIAQIAQTGALGGAGRRRRGISAAELSGFRRVSKLVCDFSRMPAMRQRRACPPPRRCK